MIDGPVQIEARIDQDPQLSGQFTLWNQQGSRVIRGHLLVIPIGRSLMFVEPIYLQAQRSPMPELRLVVLATQEKLGYGQTFEEAMNSLFGEAAAKPVAPEEPESGAQHNPHPPQHQLRIYSSWETGPYRNLRTTSASPHKANSAKQARNSSNTNAPSKRSAKKPNHNRRSHG